MEVLAQPKQSGEEYLIDILRDRSIPLEQIILVKGQPSNSDGMVSSLQVHSLVSLIDNDIASKPEPEKIIIDTCAYLIHIMQEIYKTQYQQKDNLVVDQLGMNALQRALSVRVKALPNERNHNIDGCTSILTPPDTSEQVLPSTITKEVEDFLFATRKMRDILFKSQFTHEDGSLFTVDEIREEVVNTGRGNPLVIFIMGFSTEYTLEQCLDAFSPASMSSDEFINDYAKVDEFINEYATGKNLKGEGRDMVDICAFAGIVMALRDQARGKGETVDMEFEEDDLPDYPWEMNPNKPKKNDVYYCVKLGAILHHAQIEAKRMVKKPPAGSAFSHPRARFHQDMSKEEVLPKGDGVALTPQDVSICRSRHDYVEDDSFGGGDDSVYSSRCWCHDGLIGFTHQGAGYKYREFYGHVYSCDKTDDGGWQINSKELGNEFWSTPTTYLADATNDTVWVFADQRIKGFAANRRLNGNVAFFNTSYIFQMADKLQLKEVQRSGDSVKRQKVESSTMKSVGGTLLSFGTERIGYLDNYILQEWNLNDTNRHDGINRMVDMGSVDEDIAQWPAEDVLNLSNNTWMDDTGSAEVTRGKKPDSLRLVDIETPTSVGYLSDNRLSFAYRGHSQIPIYNKDLREISRLVAFGSDDGVDIVHRPTFESMGEENIFVASDKTCVKIFDLRTTKAAMTIRQKCINSTPISVNGNKFLCNKLGSGKGAQMWDLRTQQALYSLPVKWDTDIAWLPAVNNSSAALLTGNGECYKFGKDYDQDDEWEKRGAIQAWADLEKQRSSGGGGEDCCIM